MRVSNCNNSRHLQFLQMRLSEENIKRPGMQVVMIISSDGPSLRIDMIDIYQRVWEISEYPGPSSPSIPQYVSPEWFKVSARHGVTHSHRDMDLQRGGYTGDARS